MKKTKLSPPWNQYARKLMCLFSEDEDIHVEQEDKDLTIYVDSTDKYEALTHLLPEKKEFGNVTMNINIVPADDTEKTNNDYIKALFKGNDAVYRIVEVPIGSNSMTFVEFCKEVVQYYNDNAADLHGNRTTVMEEIAREIFDNIDGIYFCTDNKEKNDNG